MLTISTWLWGDKYSVEDVRKLRNGVKRHLHQPYRFIVMTEKEREWLPAGDIERHPIPDPDLLKHPGCFARLRMFDYGWQKRMNITGRLVCMDLDSIVIATIDPLFDRDETFVILGGANSMNPCPFNGSLMMLRTGHHEEVWNDFSIEEASKLPCYAFPDDQGWLAYKLPNAATWQSGRKSGVVGFKKPGWPPNSLLPPPGVRLVVFPGKRQPRDYYTLNWVRENWQ